MSVEIARNSPEHPTVASARISTARMSARVEAAVRVIYDELP